MSYGGFGAGGFLEGFAQAYNQARQRGLQRELDSRHALGQNLMAIYQNPNTRDEVKQDIVGRMMKIYTTPPGKSLDKGLSDVTTLGQQQIQGQAQAGAAQGAAQTQALNRQINAPETLPQPPGAQAGMPPPGAGAQVPQAAGGIPLSQTPPPAQPPMALTYTPEEHAQQLAYQTRVTTEAQTTAQLQAYRDAYAQVKQEHPDWSDMEVLAAMGRNIPITAFMPTLRPETIVGLDGQPTNANFNPRTGQYTKPGTGEVIDNPVPWKPQINAPSTAFAAYRVAGQQAGKPLQQIVDEWNTTHSTTNGYKLVAFPDGHTEMVPVTTTTTRTKGGAQAPAGGIPAPPGATPSGAAPAAGGRAGVGPGIPVGGKIPPQVATAMTDYQSAISRYNVMSEALPKALAGDQQAMISLLYNHIGMTTGLQKGARITQDIIREAQTSAPWLATILSRIGVGNEFTMTPELLRGVVIPPQMMHQMIGLAEDMVGEKYRQMNDLKSQFAGGTPPTPEAVAERARKLQKGEKAPPLGATPPPPTGGKQVKMRPPGGPADGSKDQMVNAGDVAHYQGLGATVIK